MKENYYEKLIVDIEKLIKDSKYEEANSLIEEELSLPYVPMKVEKRLLVFRNEIRSFVTHNRTIMEAEKIFEILINAKDIDKVDLIDSLSEFNLKKYEKEIRQILISKEEEIPYIAKVRLMHHLLIQKIGGLWDVVTNQGISKSLDLTNKKPITEDKDFNLIAYNINQILFKHPVVLTMALNLLENIFFEMIFEEKRPDMSNGAETVSLLAARLSKDEKLIDELLEKFGDKISLPEETGDEIH